jgi:hypothetical protein
MDQGEVPAVARRGADPVLDARIHELAAGGGTPPQDGPPPDPEGMARWFGSHPGLIRLSRQYDIDVTLHVVANCVDDLVATGHPELAVATLERMFVEAHAERDGEAIARATWCGWLLAGLKER